MLLYYSITVIIMNAFEELHNKKLININDTFYIVNVFHDIQWDKNITDILLALGVTKIFHVKDPLFEENIEQNEETISLYLYNHLLAPLRSRRGTQANSS